MKEQGVEGQIEGRQPVLEALRAARPINRVMVARGCRKGSIREIEVLARQQGLVIQEVERQRLDALAQGRNHQGVIAIAAAQAYADIDQIIATAAARGEEPLILVLDGIEDPQNLGSLVRTADAVGVHGLIIPKRRSAGLTPVVGKVSAGAMEHVPVARVANLVQAVEELKELGLWIVGTHQEAHDIYHRARLTGPLAVVIGGEGKGISRLVKEHCDMMVRLPMRGHVGSLNAAVAGAVLLYEIRRQRDHPR